MYLSVMRVKGNSMNTANYIKTDYMTFPELSEHQQQVVVPNNFL